MSFVTSVTLLGLMAINFVTFQTTQGWSWDGENSMSFSFYEMFSVTEFTTNITVLLLVTFSIVIGWIVATFVLVIVGAIRNKSLVNPYILRTVTIMGSAFVMVLNLAVIIGLLYDINLIEEEFWQISSSFNAGFYVIIIGIFAVSIMNIVGACFTKGKLHAMTKDAKIPKSRLLIYEESVERLKTYLRDGVINEDMYMELKKERLEEYLKPE